MEKVLYVGYYGILEEKRKTRNYSVAAAKKMDFVASALTRIGKKVEIVSPAYITDTHFYYKEKTNQEIAPDIELTMTPSWGGKNKILRIGRVLYSKIWLFNYLLLHANKNNPVIVYHNYELAFPLLLAWKIKHFRIVLEIEEQYSMVWKLSRLNKFKEDLLLKHGKQRSLVVSEVLAEKLGIEYPVVSYGNYNAYKGEISANGQNNVIRLIYTGTIDKVKNSAYIAMEIMTYLPSNYELKISGPIVKGEKDTFLNALNSINHKCRREACEYLGLLGDNEYSELLKSADIALNLQQDGEFGQFLFPSKILTYLSYNLPVVSTKGESIVKSAIADIVYFVDDYGLDKMAEKIMSINLSEKINRREYLDKMARKFTNELRELLSN